MVRSRQQAQASKVSFLPGVESAGGAQDRGPEKTLRPLFAPHWHSLSGLASFYGGRR